MTRIIHGFQRSGRARACSAALLGVLLLSAPAIAAGPERESLPIGAPGSGAPAPVGTASTLRTVVSLGVVVGLIVGTGVGLRFLARVGVGKSLGVGAGAPSGVVEVLARYPAGRGLTLVVLKIDRRVLLLGQVASTTGRVDSVSTLTSFDDADDVASLMMKTQDEQGRSLSAKFREALSGFHAPRDSATGEDDAFRTTTRGDDGDEVALIDERGAGGSLDAFRRGVGSLRTSRSAGGGA